jgi:methionyl aminopeptidase
MTLLEVASAVEGYIKKEGCSVAFPINIAIGDIAAHYTPTYQDPKIFKKGDIVKIDVGAHLKGYIGDTARSMEVGTKDNLALIKASEKALDEAIAMIRPGIDLGEVGAVIETVIRSKGFKPIKNLAGHSVERYNLHGAITVPNTKDKMLGVVRSGDVLAIEPFATIGKGKVEEGAEGSIYTFISKKMYNRKDANTLQHFILTKNDWRFLPFCQRMCISEAKDMSPAQVESALKQMVRAGGIYPFKVLKEVSGAPVVQTEHTVLVTKQGAEVLTVDKEM